MTPFAVTWRSVRRGTLAWAAIVCVAMSAGAKVYKSAYATPAERAQFAASFGRSRGLDALYGRAVRIDTVGGFLWWRYGTSIAVMVALWGVLSTTRVLRGDEETGRTEALLASRLHPRRLMRSQLAAIALSCVLIALASTLACLLSGLAVRGTALLTLGLLLSALVFAAVAALVSQVTHTRRRAAGATGIGLGSAYLVRALADGAPHLHWLSWLTPLGWVERISPFGPDHSIVAIALLATATAASLGLAFVVRTHRDTGDSALAEREHTTRPRRVRSLTALDVLLQRGSFIGWTTASVIAGLLFGFIAADIAKSVAADRRIDRRTANLTGQSIATVRGFIGLSFMIIAVVVALYAGAQLNAARSQEAEGRVANLLTHGATRRAWFGVRLAGALVAVLAVTTLAGFAMWAGVRLSGQPFALADSLRGAVNTLPVSLLYMGLAVLAFGIAPRAVGAVAYGSVALSYALLIVTALGNAPRWVIDLSPLSHLAPVPAAAANRLASVVLLAIAAVTTIAGALGFGRRDLEGE
jgi:ABC-2 type transport system permease protein